MFLWDDVGETRIRFGEGGEGRAHGVDWASAGLAALLDACTVPIAIHDHARAGILGTGTLLKCGERLVLLTAAHLFEGATSNGHSSSGNWLIPERASGQLLSLEGAHVHVIGGADIALVDLARATARPRLLRGRVALPGRLALRSRLAARRRNQRTTTRIATYCLAGYPAAWSRFERGYLAAKRLTITTQTARRRDDGADSGSGACADEHAPERLGDLRCIYGRIAERNDGTVIHTPALEGMSGAAIWEIGEIERSNSAAAMHLAGVQSSFLHSRYLRGDAARSCELFFCS